jgi:hypothetical protein
MPKPTKPMKTTPINPNLSKNPIRNKNLKKKAKYRGSTSKKDSKKKNKNDSQFMF